MRCIAFFFVVAESVLGTQQLTAAQFNTSGANGQFGKGKKQKIGGVERFWLEAHTRAEAKWVFKDLKRRDYRNAIRLRYRFRVARAPYRSSSEKPTFELRLVNPKTKLVARLPEVEFTEGTGSGVLQIPVTRRVEARRDNRGPLRRYDVFGSFVTDGKLEVRIVNLQFGTLLGAEKQSLTIVQSKRRNKPSKDSTIRKASENTTATTFQAAMKACEAAWKDYERHIRKIDGFRYTDRAILLADELRIKRRLDGKLSAALAAIRRHLKKKPGDHTALRHAGVLALLLNDEKQAWDWLKKAAKKDEKLKSWILLNDGLRSLVRNDLDLAAKHLAVSLKLKPDNPISLLAYYDCRKLQGKMVPAEVAAKVKKVSKAWRTIYRSAVFNAKLTPTSAWGPRRVLPWLYVFPVDESIRKLTRKAGAKETTTGKFR